MEEKRITEKESLELITLMIENTKDNMEKGSGRMLLLWGYLSALVALSVFVSWHITGNTLTFLGWWAIPLIGFPLQFIIHKKSPKRIITYVDKAVGQVWKVTGTCAVLTPFVYMFASFPILFAEALLISMGATMTGLLTKYKTLAVTGSAGILLSYLLLFVTAEYQILVFAALFVILMIVPGHLLNAECVRKSGKINLSCSEN